MLYSSIFGDVRGQKKKFNRLPRFKIDLEKQCVCCLKTPWKTVLTCSPDGSLKTDLREINMEHTRWRTLNRPPQNHTIHHSECEHWKLPCNIISYIMLDSDWSWVCREQHSSVMETKGFNFLLKVTLCWTFHVCKWTENRAATQHIRGGWLITSNWRSCYKPERGVCTLCNITKTEQAKVMDCFFLCISLTGQRPTLLSGGNGEVDFTQLLAAKIRGTKNVLELAIVSFLFCSSCCCLLAIIKH